MPKVNATELNKTTYSCCCEHYVHLCEMYDNVDFLARRHYYHYYKAGNFVEQEERRRKITRSI